MLKSLFPSTADPGRGDFSRDELLAIRGDLPAALRASVASYLSSASMLFPWMEMTDDLVGRQFNVPGGSAIMSDGIYYWRLDTANYVETYGIGLDSAFLDHANSLNWTCPILDESTFLELYEELEAVMQSYARERAEPSSLRTFYPQK